MNHKLAIHANCNQTFLVSLLSHFNRQLFHTFSSNFSYLPPKFLPADDLVSISLRKPKTWKENFYRFPPCNCPLAQTSSPNSRLIHLTASLAAHRQKVTRAKLSSWFSPQNLLPPHPQRALSVHGSFILLDPQPKSLWVILGSCLPSKPVHSQQVLLVLPLKYIENLTSWHPLHQDHPRPIL